MRSITGIKKARVFPLPVIASTTTSLLPINNGIVDACTGVILSKPKLDTASSIHGDNDGVSDVQARGFFSTTSVGVFEAIFLALAFRFAAAAGMLTDVGRNFDNVQRNHSGWKHTKKTLR
jgi:hypothetical protein